MMLFLHMLGKLSLHLVYQKNNSKSLLISFWWAEFSIKFDFHWHPALPWCWRFWKMHMMQERSLELLLLIQDQSLKVTWLAVYTYICYFACPHWYGPNTIPLFASSVQLFYSTQFFYAFLLSFLKCFRTDLLQRRLFCKSVQRYSFDRLSLFLIHFVFPFAFPWESYNIVSVNVFIIFWQFEVLWRFTMFIFPFILLY